MQKRKTAGRRKKCRLEDILRLAGFARASTMCFWKVVMELGQLVQGARADGELDKEEVEAICEEVEELAANVEKASEGDCVRLARWWMSDATSQTHGF